ncbi:MAG: hypothetical protein JOZ11_01720 [Alphaproteobacteria bacterium]|nr:hypothetical protein [Alphaproteobacteria bacterium]
MMGDIAWKGAVVFPIGYFPIRRSIDTDPLKWHVKLVGDDLGDRDIHALAHVHLAEIGDDIALPVDGEPAGEVVGGKRWLYGSAGLRRGEAAGGCRSINQRARALEKAPAVDRELSPPPPPKPSVPRAC